VTCGTGRLAPEAVCLAALVQKVPNKIKKENRAGLEKLEGTNSIKLYSG
jgi:hypothetical protein